MFGSRCRDEQCRVQGHLGGWHIWPGAHIPRWNLGGCQQQNETTSSSSDMLSSSASHVCIFWTTIPSVTGSVTRTWLSRQVLVQWHISPPPSFNSWSVPTRSVPVVTKLCHCHCHWWMFQGWAERNLLLKGSFLSWLAVPHTTPHSNCTVINSVTFSFGTWSMLKTILSTKYCP